MPIYRSGTIGKAKEDLEAQTAGAVGGAARARRRRRMGQRQQGAGHAGVAAIPVVPLYISALYRVMKEAGTHEGTAEQIARLFRDHLGPGRTPATDAGGRIRIDDLGDGSGGAGAGQRDVEDGDQRDPDVGDRLRRVQARLSRAVRLRGSGRRLRGLSRPRFRLRSRLVGRRDAPVSPAAGRGSLSPLRPFRDGDAQRGDRSPGRLLRFAPCRDPAPSGRRAGARASVSRAAAPVFPSLAK